MILLVLLQPVVLQLLERKVDLLALFRQPDFLLGCAGVLAGGVLFSGFYPAFVQWSYTTTMLFKPKHKVSARHFNPRKPLVVGQFTASIILLVGVVNDYHQESLRKEIPPIVYYCGYKWIYDVGYYAIKFNSADVRATVEAIRKIWEKIYPLDNFEYRFLDETFDQQYQGDRRFGTLFTLFTLLAVFVACLGLQGLATYAIERRTKEIGIRKVNGATAGQIVVMLTAEFAALVAIAFVIACPIAYQVMNSWLQNYAYRTNLGWVVFLAAGVLALAAVLYVLLRDGGSRMNVARAKVTIERVRNEVFQDFIAVIGSVEPLQIVHLDATEGGRIAQGRAGAAWRILSNDRRPVDLRGRRADGHGEQAADQARPPESQFLRGAGGTGRGRGSDHVELRHLRDHGSVSLEVNFAGIRQNRTCAVNVNFRGSS
jgi:hypothetical protein